MPSPARPVSLPVAASHRLRKGLMASTSGQCALAQIPFSRCTAVRRKKRQLYSQVIVNKWTQEAFTPRLELPRSPSRRFHLADAKELDRNVHDDIAYRPYAQLVSRAGG